MNEKSFNQRLQEGRGEKLDDCPFCGNTVQVYETPQGLIDCYRCGTAPVRTQTILVGEGDDRRAITIPADEESDKKQARDCFFASTKRNIERGGGSSSGKSRKKQVKRTQSRVEQEPVSFNTGNSGGIVIKRKVERYAEADQRVKLYIPEWFREVLKTEVRQRSKMDSRKWTMIQVIRSAMWGHAKHVDMVKSFEYGKGDRRELQILLYPDEKKLLDESCAAKDCSHGEFVAACVEMFAEA